MIDMDARNSVRQVMLRSTLFSALGMAALASVGPRPLLAQRSAMNWRAGWRKGRRPKFLPR